MKPLWITYAWVDNEDGNFDYLVTELENSGIPTKYDRVAIVPGRRLWEQIDKHLQGDDLAGWAWLITPESLSSEPCREELAYALNQALDRKGNSFPLIGLLANGVEIKSLPQALSTRLCIDLRSPDWVEQVRAGLENRAPSRTPTDTSPYHVDIHEGFQGDAKFRAIEVRPRFREISHWRIAFPVDTPGFVQHGTGPAGADQIGGVAHSVLDGTTKIGDLETKVVGSGDRITPGVSAFVVFSGVLPKQVFVGEASGPWENPTKWVVISNG